MIAVHLSDNQLTLKTDQPQPQPRPGEALLRVRLAGICSTDLEIVRGYVPDFSGVLGHEFVGEVVACADDASWVGRRVTGSINIACGECAVCHVDGPEHCPERTVLGILNKDGVMAEYVTLPIRNLVAIPETVSDEMAVFTEPLAAAVRIREQVKIRPTARVAVVGPGRLGMLIGRVLALAGTEVTMLGRRESPSLSLAARWGLSTAVVSTIPDDSFDLVVEATGNIHGFEHALRLVRPLGTLVMKSTYAESPPVDMTKIVVGEITVVGSRCGPFAPAVRLLQQGQVAVEDLITAVYPLRDALTAFEKAAEPGVLKVLLKP